jgi:hypothetical protein
MTGTKERTARNRESGRAGSGDIGQVPGRFRGHHTQLLTTPGDSSAEGTSFWPGLSDISGAFRHARNLGGMERPKSEYGVPGTIRNQSKIEYRVPETSNVSPEPGTRNPALLGQKVSMVSPEPRSMVSPEPCPEPCRVWCPRNPAEPLSPEPP